MPKSQNQNRTDFKLQRFDIAECQGNRKPELPLNLWQKRVEVVTGMYQSIIDLSLSLFQKKIHTHISASFGGVVFNHH